VLPINPIIPINWSLPEKPATLERSANCGIGHAAAGYYAVRDHSWP
jgi:hypothetical protein